MRLLLVPVVAAVLVASQSSCTNDVDNFIGPRTGREIRVRNPSPGMGFSARIDVGADAADPAEGYSLSAIHIARAGMDDLRIALLAFATAAPASEVDGSTDNDNPAVPGSEDDNTLDANGGTDVFVSAIVDSQLLVKGKDLPVGFRQGLAPIFRDPRCLRCHGFKAGDGFRFAELHAGKTTEDSKCTQCHTFEAIHDPMVVQAEEIEWRAPAIEFDMRRETDREIYDRISVIPSIAQHLREDGRILWAIQHGRVPFRGLAEGGPVPITREDWEDLAEAWELAQRPFNGAARITDVSTVLISGRQPATLRAVAGDAASFSPVLAFEPDPAFVATPGTTGDVGFVHVAFASDATDLVVGFESPNRDVFRARVPIRVRFGATLRDVRVTVDMSRASLEPVSRSAVMSGRGADGDCSEPVIGWDGGAPVVAFESFAGDLVTDFVDGNGPNEPDVFVTDGMSTTLVSLMASAPDPVSSANGGSHAPAISSDGSAVAFESDATNLIDGDRNGVRDVFFARRSGGISVARASVADGGAEAVGAPASRADVWHDAATADVWVTFESAALGLDPRAAGNAVRAAGTRSAFVHQDASRSTVRLGGASAAPSSDARIAPDGSRVVFASGASDLDPVRVARSDLASIYAFDLAAFRASPQRDRFDYALLSVSATGEQANGDSGRPRIAALLDGAGPTSEGLVCYVTEAGNLGASDTSDLVLQFLKDRAELPANALFRASRTSALLAGASGVEIAFTDLSSGQGLAAGTGWIYRWDFDGDGGFDLEGANLRNPTHVYTQQGDFSVKLVIEGPMDPGGQRPSSEYIERVRIFDEITFEVLVGEFQAFGCTNCHSPGAPAVFGELDFTTVEASYESLFRNGDISMPVESKIFRVGATGEMRKLVVPGRPEESVLSTMFRDPVEANNVYRRGMTRVFDFEAFRIDAIDEWIRDGAQR